MVLYVTTIPNVKKIYIFDFQSEQIRVRENIPILAQVMPDHEYALNICTRGIPEKKIPEPVQNPGVSSSSDSSFKSNEKHSIDDEDIQLKILNLETASKLKKAAIQLERNKRKNEMKNEINKRKNEMKYKMKLDKIKMKAEWKKIDIETEIEKKKLLSRAHK